MRAAEHQSRVDTALRSVASLGEPVRLTLYRYVVAQAEPVSREQAAAGVGVAHHVAKFHLDRLEDDRLLEVNYRRPAGRTDQAQGARLSTTAAPRATSPSACPSGTTTSPAASWPKQSPPPRSPVH